MPPRGLHDDMYFYDMSSLLDNSGVDQDNSLLKLGY